MNKNIVIFGCDNSGKTTLSEQITDLIDNLGYKVELKHSLGPVPIEEQVKFMTDNLLKDCVTIFDRFPVIEEMVCGRIIRNNNIYSDKPDIVDKTLSYVDLFIFCMPHISDVTNWGEREQMDGVKENVNSLIVGYMTLAMTLIEYGCRVVQYSWRDDLATKGELNKLIEIIMKEEEE